MVEINNLKQGDILSEHQFYKVVRVDNMRRVVVLKTDNGEEISVTNNIVSAYMDSADDFKSIVETSRTDLIEKIKQRPSTAMTIHYKKMIDVKHVKAELYNLYSNKKGSLLSEKEYKSKVDSVLEQGFFGEERTIRGRHYHSFDEFSRLNFIDMDVVKEEGKSYDTRFRKVDLRTVEWAIIENIKYVVK